MSTQPFQFSVVRYVENVVRDEAVNIGVVVRDQSLSESTAKFLTPAVISRKTSPRAVALLLGFQASLRASDFEEIGSAKAVRDPKFFSDAQREFHGNLRLSELKGILAKDLTDATERAFSSYVAGPKPSARVELTAAQLSPSKMRSRLYTAFNQADLFAPGKAKKEFQIRGRHADWTFDIGYRNGAVSLINALAISTDTPQTNLERALLFKGMVLEVMDASKDEIHPIAVISPPPHSKSKQLQAAYDEAQGILNDADIATFGLQDMPALALRAKNELETSLA
jgi:hypothetical protein